MLAWSAAAAAAAIVAAAVGILWALRAALRAIARMERSAAELERESLALLRDLRSLAADTATTASAVRGHVQRSEALFAAAGELGEALRATAKTAGKLTEALSDSADRHLTRAGGIGRERLSEALSYAEMGWTAWKWVQAKREEAAAFASDPRQDEEHDSDERSEQAWRRKQAD